jgi:hypothetical protein
MHSVGHNLRIHIQALLWHENILKIEHVITVAFVYSHCLKVCARYRSNYGTV